MNLSLQEMSFKMFGLQCGFICSRNMDKRITALEIWLCMEKDEKFSNTEVLKNSLI